MTNLDSSVVRKNLVKKYPLLAFFVFAYVLFIVSLMVIGVFVTTRSVSAVGMSTLVAIASWTPNAAAFVVIRGNKEPNGIRKVFAGWLRWHVPAGWYLFGLAPLIIVAAIVWGSLSLGNPSPGGGSGITVTAILSMVLFNTIQGATGEELGWRGFALPKLQARYNRLVSAVILGVVIAGWHSILHLISPTGVPEWQFWLILVCYSVVAAWIYNHTGSLLIVSLFHFSFNFGLELVVARLGLISITNLFWGYVGVYFLLALGVILQEGKLMFVSSKNRSALPLNLF